VTDVDFGAFKLKKILVKNGLLKCGKLVGFSLLRAGLCTTYKLIIIISQLNAHGCSENDNEIEKQF
jgi:hypothetical protein